MIKLSEIAYQVINEQGRSKVITWPEAVDMLKKHCSRFDPDKHGPLYRGVDFAGGFGFVDPSKSVRRSANTKNFYTLLIDNSPRWKAFPKRSRSIICTNDQETADIYGDPFYIVPFDGSRIGVCPANDMWYSFDFKIGGLNHLHDLNNTLFEIAKNVGVKLRDDTYKNLSDDLETVSEKIHDDPEAAKRDLPRYVGDLIDPFLKSGWDMENFIQGLLDPKKNGFRLKKWPDSISKTVEQEIWTDGPSVMILADMKDDIFNEVYK